MQQCFNTVTRFLFHVSFDFPMPMLLWQGVICRHVWMDVLATAFWDRLWTLLKAFINHWCICVFFRFDLYIFKIHRNVNFLGHDSYQSSSHWPRLSQAQCSLTMQKCGLKSHSPIHSFTFIHSFILLFIHCFYTFWVDAFSFCPLWDLLMCQYYYVRLWLAGFTE